MNDHSGSHHSHPRGSRPLHEPEEVDFGGLLADLWEGRLTILICMVAFLAVGGFMSWRSAPVYEAEGLLQFHAKKTSEGGSPLAKVEGLFSEATVAAAEVEILKSDMVLGRAVKELRLDLVARPKLFPLIGEALARGRADAPRLDVEVFQVPERMAGKAFRIKALPDGLFRWTAPAGATLASGRPGELLSAVLDGEIVKLQIRTLVGKPGQEFRVLRQPLSVAVAGLRKRFDAAERGKETNVIGLSCKDTSPERCALVLNTIVSQYVAYKIERKAGDANETRALIEAKLGPLKAELEASERRLNQFRSRYGSVDLSREAETMLLQSSQLNSQVTALEQRRQEALRTHRETSDVVRTIDLQIAHLKEESTKIGARMQALPGTQQEVVRLSRDVQVNTDLYTALLNNVQQLQIASAGDVGRVSVVDPASVNPEPIGAKTSVMVAFALALGGTVGAGLVMVRQLLHKGIKDHRLIESKLGIPVLVTVPHSRDQEALSEAVRSSQEGAHLLVAQKPEDLAVESLRSLRTSLLFSIKEARNRAIMVTGPSPGVGKSFLCGNLAIMLAQTGAKVLLVDADLRRGNLHRYFGLKTRLDGLSNVLSGRSDRKEMTRASGFDGLDLMTTGIIPPDASQLLLSPRFGAFVAEAEAAYDFVIFDVPPILPVTDATIIGPHVGTSLLVARFGVHPLDELRACVQRASAHDIHFAGCIFNDLMPLGLGYGSRSYRYAYHYKYQ